MVVGEFVDKDKNPYAIVVNKNPYYPVSVGVKFKKEGEVYKVEDRNIGEQVRDLYGEETIIAPGHGVILFTK